MFDHYHFTTSDEFTITVRGTSEDFVEDFAPRITLLTDGLVEIATSDNGSLSHTPSGQGTFVVRVEAANAGGAGFYVISGGEPFEEREPNHTFANATRYSYWSALRGFPHCRRCGLFPLRPERPAACTPSAVSTMKPAGH